MQLAIETPDADFLSAHIRPVLSEGEVQRILERVELELLPDLSDLVSDWEASYYGSQDPDEYFEPMREALAALHEAYPEGSSSRSKLSSAIYQIDSASEDIREQGEKDEGRYEPDYEMYEGYGYTSHAERSIFDDVDK